MDSQAQDLLDALMNIDLDSHMDKIRKLTRKSPKEEPKPLGTFVVKLTLADGTVVDEMTLSIAKDAKSLEGFFGLVLLQKYQTRPPGQPIIPPITIMDREDEVAKGQLASPNELPKESGPSTSGAHASVVVPKNHKPKNNTVVRKNDVVSQQGNAASGLKETVNTPPPRQK
jgi:hypothetical protein